MPKKIIMGFCNKYKVIPPKKAESESWSWAFIAMMLTYEFRFASIYVFLKATWNSSFLSDIRWANHYIISYIRFCFSYWVYRQTNIVGHTFSPNQQHVWLQLIGIQSLFHVHIYTMKIHSILRKCWIPFSLFIYFTHIL